MGIICSKETPEGTRSLEQKRAPERSDDKAVQAKGIASIESEMQDEAKANVSLKVSSVRSHLQVSGPEEVREKPCSPEDFPGCAAAQRRPV